MWCKCTKEAGSRQISSHPIAIGSPVNRTQDSTRCIPETDYRLLVTAYWRPVADFQVHHILHVHRMREQIDRLYRSYRILFRQYFKVACLCGRVAAYVDNFFWRDLEQHSANVFMHSGAGWVCDNYIGRTMFVDEAIVQKIFYVAGKKGGVADAVD